MGGMDVGVVLWPSAHQHARSQPNRGETVGVGIGA